MIHTLSIFILITASYACVYKALDGTCYGHDLKDKYFLLASDFTNLNHGSYGTVPKPVAERQNQYFMEQEAHPDTWFRVSYYNYIDDSRAKIASFVNTLVDNIVLVENASNAVNSILRSLGFKKGDKVLYLSTAYGMVTETLNWLAQTIGIETIIVTVEFPMKDYSQMLSAVTAALSEHPDVKLCVFSHISSMPSLIEPVSELTSLVRSLTTNALVLIDGAHAPGQIPVDISAISPDFYLGNCHKWLFSPKGTAFLYVASGQQLELSPEPTVISSSGKHTYTGRYSYTGTRDYTGFTSIPTALSFRDEVLGGNDRIITYGHTLAVEASQLLVDLWGTFMLIPIELTSFMFSVVLPSTDADAIAFVQSTLDTRYNIYMVYSWIADSREIGKSRGNFTDLSSFNGGILPLLGDGHFTAINRSSSNSSEDLIYYTRLSAQVYVELSDFQRLGELVIQLLDEYSNN